MTTIPKSVIKTGSVWFYGPDPVFHSALLVTGTGDRVTAFASAKEMKLDFDPKDLITTDQLVAQTVKILELREEPLWHSMVVGRMEALAAGIKLVENRETLLTVQVDQLCDVIRGRLASTAKALEQSEALLSGETSKDVSTLS
jgi:hypothetical protein